MDNPLFLKVKPGDAVLYEKNQIGKILTIIGGSRDPKGWFHLQKDDEKRLSLNALQTKMTYHQLIEFGYKLQKPKIKFTNKD